MVMKLEQITEALKNKHLETVKKELCRYGDILDVQDWEDHHGAHRCYTIQYQNASFDISMLNGATINIKQG